MASVDRNKNNPYDCVLVARGIDVGTQKSYYTDVRFDGDGFRIVDFGEWKNFLPRVDVVGVEFPDPIVIPRRLNAHTIIALCRVAATIGLLEGVSSPVEFVEFGEWTGKAPSSRTRSAIDSVFLKIFRNASSKGRRYYVDGKIINEHNRDAALIAAYVLRKKIDSLRGGNKGV